MKHVHRFVRVRSLVLLPAVGVLASGCGGSSSGLFVVSPNGDEPKKVASGCIAEISWSPDGESVAVVRDGGLVLVNAQSGDERQLAKDGGTPTWSPDGLRIAYRDSQVRLWVAPTHAESKPRLIWQGSRARGSPDNPAWSPDGAQIAIAAGLAHGGRITVLRPDGSGVTSLTGELADTTPLRWFPHGKRLLFLEDRLGAPLPAPASLSLINADGSGRRHLVKLSTSGTANMNYAISPDGRRVVYDVFGGSTEELYVINADGSGKRRLGQAEFLRFGDWSPDSTKIVFWQWRDDDPSTLYLADADGTGKRTVLARASGGGGVPPRWSSRGQIGYVDNSGCSEGSDDGE